MRVEEFRLLLPAIGTLAVPPQRALAVEDGARCTGDGNIDAGDGDDGTEPFGIAEGCAAFEDDLKYVLVLSDLLLSLSCKANLHECLSVAWSDRESCLQAQQYHSML